MQNKLRTKVRGEKFPLYLKKVRNMEKSEVKKIGQALNELIEKCSPEKQKMIYDIAKIIANIDMDNKKI